MGDEVNITCRIEVRLAWWWSWLYLPGVSFLTSAGMEPDMEKVAAMLKRAVRVRLVPPNA